MKNTYFMFNFKTFDKESLIKRFNVKDNTINMVTSDKNNSKIQGFLEYPKKTRYGFRQIFGRVFSYGFSYEPEDLKIEIEETKYKITSVLLLISTDNDMDYMEKDNLMLVISVNGNNMPIETIEQYTKIFNDLNKQEKNLKNYLQKIFNCYIDDIFSTVTTEVYDFKYEKVDNEVSALDYDLTFTAMSAFYYYAFLLQYRLERMQVAIQVGNNHNESFRNINNDIIKQKTYLLNLNRYFLTRNRSVDSAVKDFSNTLLEKFKLRDKILDRERNINLFTELVERQFSKLQEERGKSIKLAVQLIMFFSIPLAIVSTAMSLNMNSDVMVNPIENIITHRGVISLFIFSIIMPLAVIASGVIIDYLNKWRKN